MLNKYIYIFLISMVPLVELRGAIPFAEGFGLPFLPSYIVCIIGNMLPVPIIYLFARKVLEWGADKPLTGKFFTFCLEKGEKAERSCRKKREEDFFCKHFGYGFQIECDCRDAGRAACWCDHGRGK